MTAFILASSSPRRQQMFQDLQAEFTVVVPDIDESVLKGEKPVDYVRRVAREKALAVSARQPNQVVLAADTTVALGRSILGKPSDKADAENMLHLMSGRRQNVISAVCVIDARGNLHEDYTITKVKIKPLSKMDIKRHISHADNWQGKAGGYGIQTTAGGALIHSIQGSHTGVVGLPLPQAINLLRRCNIEL